MISCTTNMNMGKRRVSFLPGDETGCLNCYKYNFPCTSCKVFIEESEYKIGDMIWNDFKNITGDKVFIELYGKVPDDYEEWCKLFNDHPSFKNTLVLNSNENENKDEGDDEKED